MVITGESVTPSQEPLLRESGCLLSPACPSEFQGAQTQEETEMFG